MSILRLMPAAHFVSKGIAVVASLFFVVAPMVWGWIADHRESRMAVVRLASLLTIVSFSAFTLWIYVHDDIFRGVSTQMSHAMVAIVAWVFGVAGTLIINRLYRRAETLARKSARPLMKVCS